MFGLGAQEIAILIVMAVILFGLPITIIVLILFLNRRRNVRISELEEENRRLQDEAEELRGIK